MAEFSVPSKTGTQTLDKSQILDNDDQSIDKSNNHTCDLNEAVNLECNKDNNEVVKECDYDYIRTTNTKSALMLQDQFGKIQIGSTDDLRDDLHVNSVGTKPKIKNHVHRPQQIGTDHIESRSKQPQCDLKSDDAKSLAHSHNSGPAVASTSSECAIGTVPQDSTDTTDNSVQKHSSLGKQTLLKSQSLDLGIDDCAFLSIDRKLHNRLLPNINEYRSTDSEIQLDGDETNPTAYDTQVKPSEESNPRLAQRPSATSMMLQSAETRPIYPNVPYSPYGSPFGSPRSVRRRPPLRESRRISIERSGSFLQLNQYKLMDKIGQGSYGLVKLAYSEEDSTHYAMKILSKKRLLRQAALMRRSAKQTTSPLDRVYREIAVLKKLDHPNIVKLVEVLDDPVEDSLYMVFELVKNGEVLSIPTNKPLSEERAWSVFRDTLLGLEYLHYQKIIHADLKPGNLLLTECGHVKIADLGVCNEFLGEDATMSNGSTAGTPAFRAPETLVLGKSVYCGRASDIWALGITLFSLVYGNVPFVDSSIPKLYEKIQNDEVFFPEVPKISDDLRHTIARMLEKDATNRITLPQLKVNPWVTRNGLCPLPTEDENCCLVQIDDEDINSVVRSIPKLDTLILIKTMLKNHSFGNPFMKGISGRAPQPGGSRLQKFIQAGRSNSAPGSYHITLDKQQSSENTLPSLSEHCTNQNI